jgi:hypothetical protein
MPSRGLLYPNNIARTEKDLQVALKAPGAIHASGSDRLLPNCS